MSDRICLGSNGVPVYGVLQQRKMLRAMIADLQSALKECRVITSVGQHVTGAWDPGYPETRTFTVVITDSVYDKKFIREMERKRKPKKPVAS